MVNGHHFNILVRFQTKIHKANGCLKFLNECKSENILPKFTEIPDTVLKYVNWSPSTIIQKRKEKIDIEIVNQLERLHKNKLKFSNFLNNDCSHFSKTQKRNLEFSCIDFVKKIEYRTDRRRDLKLEKLRLTKQPNFEVIKVINFTKVNIPHEINEILKFGSETAVGGTPNDFKILKEMEKLLCKWETYAISKKTCPIKILETKGDLIHNFKQLRKCYSPNDNSKKLTKFLDSHPDILIVKVDKSKNLAILYKKDYEEKLSNEFPYEKYTELNKDPLENDMKSYRALIRDLEPFISKRDFYSMKPVGNLKSAYGILKLHKEEPYPVRPIVSSLNSIVQGGEEYLLPILKKFNCKYSLSSTKEFREYFLKNRTNFYRPRSEIISFDVKSLFPSVDIDYTAKFIIEEIYKNPKEFFEPCIRESDSKRVLFPPKHIFEKFFYGVLKKFTAFKTPSGFYRQKYGVSMGSKISPVLSDIFMSLIERNIVDPLIETDKILGYRRYVDDIFIVLHNRDDRKNIFEIFNTAHHGLTFTMDLPVSGKLNFLDTSIYFDKNLHRWEICQYTKDIKSRVIQNYNSISPFSTRNGTLVGEIYRARNCTSSDENLELALVDLTDKFISNGYPRKLIKDKIKEVKDRKFSKKIREVDYEKGRSENPERFFTFCGDFTSRRCEKVGNNLRKILRKVTPDFQISFAWKTVTLNNCILPRLKNQVGILDKCNCVYEFKCVCGDFYIGETSRMLKLRASEHGQPSKESVICSHINSCDKYIKKLSDSYDTLNPGVRKRKEFLLNHFKIRHKNLVKYTDRTIIEAIFIRLYKPNLNIQNDHRAIKLV